MSKSIREEQYEKQYERLFIRLSGHFLSEHLDDNFWDLDYEDEQLKMIEEYHWQPFEYHSPEDVYSFIDSLTEDVMRLMEGTVT